MLFRLLGSDFKIFLVLAFLVSYNNIGLTNSVGNLTNAVSLTNGR